MNSQILQTAMTRISVDLRQQLLRAVEHCRQVPQIGAVFDKPVDYARIPLPDYLQVVQRPMDLQTVERQLRLRQYEYLYEFLFDASLIFRNARAYNRGDADFLQLCDYMEQVLLEQLDKVEPRVAPEVYMVVTQAHVPALRPDERGFSTVRLQALVADLMALPERDIAACVYGFLEAKNELGFAHGQDATLRFHNCTYEQLAALERAVRERRKGRRGRKGIKKE